MSTPTLEQSRCSLAAEVLLRRGILTLKAFGTSMLPTLWPGDVVAIQSCDFNEAAAGDIVLCMRDGRFYLHRLTKKTSPGNNLLLTRGDSMPAPDPPVIASEVLGKVTEIRRGHRVIAPTRRPSPAMWALGRLLGHSNFCLRVALRLRGTLDANPDLSVSNAVL